MVAAWGTLTGVVYIVLFLATGVGCVASIPRARTFTDIEVRYGLVGLLGLTGLWALFKTAFFLVPGPLQPPVYTVGLTSGFGTVWAWLYFASAYTGRTLHRNPTLRRLAGAVFLGITALKVTNPIHGLYFTTTEVTTPFRYTAIDHGLIHWVSTSLSYVLAAIGLFMIFELYVESGHDTKPLGALTALLALPVTIDLVAIATPQLIEFIYAPIGVGAFAVGVLFVFDRQFLAVRTKAQGDAATVVLDDADRIQAHSDAAAEIFPELDGATGEPLSDVLPAVTATDEADADQVVERDGEDGPRYYLVSPRSMTLGDSTVRVLALADVTESERQRRDLIERERELDRRNELYRAIISASFAFVFRIDADGRFGYVSPSVEEFTGYSSEALTGEPISLLGSDEQAVEAVQDHLDRVLDDGESVQVRELPIETRSGGTVYADVRAEPIYDPSVASDARTPADVVGAQAMVRDAGERRKREGLISVINRVLRHNVRNKLTVINGHAEMLAADLDGEDATKADRILEAGTRLLDLSESARRIESHRELSPELEPVDVAPMVGGLLDQLTDEYPEASVTAQVPETALAETQPRIETALWELLNNAARYTGPEPTIDVDVTTVDGQVLVRIRDDGPGLPEAERRVLVTGEEGPLVHGQGLGLFLTHWIITNLGGEVSVATGQGTAVEVRLPAPSAATAASGQLRD
ncbi:ATP-binding protein [Halobellus ruber]|uniref:histidine kinase n=1 Tax=Halobellus ruber TaxID=2761102 RepID=A0A7J9SLK4_9EURY|nr:ATP-binding protein [Halobellus ruber]MBB6647402.1 PAS domain S-box protein [Halobellus ruber]